MEGLEKLEIKGTPSTPQVIFETNGNMVLKGRIIPENASQMFKPMIEWAGEVTCKSILFTIDLEYVNTGGTNQLYILLKTLDDNPSIEDISIIWNYDEDDEDHLEAGRFFEDRLARIKFSYSIVSN